MVTEMGSEAHFLNAVVDFMEFPEERNPVQQNMGKPLQEIKDDKEQE
jgi:hypothetical protein